MKAVWLLGAGFSKDANYPLVSDFLDPQFFVHRIVHEHLRGGFTDPLRGLIKELEEWSKLDTDLNRLMLRYHEEQNAEKVTALNLYILNTLELINSFHRDNFGAPYLSAFIQQIGASNSTVISFNYDTIVEARLCLSYINGVTEENDWNVLEVPYDLGIDSQKCTSLYGEERLMDYGIGYVPNKMPENGDLKLLKLHGSTCLRLCRNCKKYYYLVFSHFPFPCPKCNDDERMDLVMVPPASSNRSFIGWEILKDLWIQAEEELLSASHLVIVGYSLSDEDEMARELFRRVSEKNKDLNVLVVDPDPSEIFVNRFRDVFPNALFLKEGAKRLMGDLATCRTSYRNHALSKYSPEIAVFLGELISPEMSREEQLYPGIISLDEDLVGILKSAEVPARTRLEALFFLGISDSPEIRKILQTVALNEEESPTVRACAIRAAGNISDELSLNFLTRMLFNLESFTPENRFGGLILPYSFSTYAREGLINMVVEAPDLEFRPVLSALVLLSVNGLLMEHEQAQTYSAIKIFQDLSILRTEYTAEDVFVRGEIDRSIRTVSYRNYPSEHSLEEIEDLILKNGFYDRNINPLSQKQAHEYHAPFIEGDWVVLDFNAGLMWSLGLPDIDRRKSNLPNLGYALGLFRDRGYAGYHDWRLPTLEEAMSILLPPDEENWCEDPIFLRRIDRMWTSDKQERNGQLVVSLFGGYVLPCWQIEAGDAYVRMVREI